MTRKQHGSYNVINYLIPKQKNAYMPSNILLILSILMYPLFKKKDVHLLIKATICFHNCTMNVTNVVIKNILIYQPQSIHLQLSPDWSESLF